MIALTRNKGGVSVCQYERKVMRKYIINQLKELGTIITGSLVSRKAKMSPRNTMSIENNGIGNIVIYAVYGLLCM